MSEEYNVEADKVSGENMQCVYKDGESKTIHMSEVLTATEDGWVDAPGKQPEVKAVETKVNKPVERKNKK